MGVQKIENKDALTTALAAAGDKVVIIDFYADWCGPCKTISPKLEKMSNEDFADCVFLKVNVDELEEVSEDYKIQAMPTFIIIKNGKKVDEVVGANEENIKQTIRQHKK